MVLLADCYLRYIIGETFICVVKKRSRSPVIIKSGWKRLFNGFYGDTPWQAILNTPTVGGFHAGCLSSTGRG